MTWFSKHSQFSKFGNPKKGTDGSDRYIDNKKVEFIVYSVSNQAVVSFKPFIQKISCI